MAEGLRIPITVDFKNSLQKLNEAKKYFSDLASGAEKSLGIIGTSASGAAAALTPLAQAAASARASIVAFGEGKENIEQVIPLFQELVAQAGGIDQAFEQLQDIPFFEEFVRGAEEAVLAAERLDGKDVTIDINAEGLESVRTQLREARTELDNAVLKFGELSPEADAAAKKVAELNDVIETSGRRAQGADLKGKFELAGRAIAGVAAAFQTVTALQAVFGSESKKTEEALKKVQAVMALTQGIQGVLQGAEAFKELGNSAITALKGIKSGIAATGIGLLLVALGTIVAYWDDIKEAVGGVSEENKKLAESSKSVVESEKQKLDLLNNQDNILKLQGKSEKEILQLKLNQIKNVIKATEAQIAQDKINRDLALAAEKRNAQLLRSYISLVSAPLNFLFQTGAKAVNGLISLINKIPGVAIDFQLPLDLVENAADFITKQVFDPKALEDEGKKANQAAENQLNDLKNTQAGYVLQLQKGSENAKKALQDLTPKVLQGQPITIPVRLSRLEELKSQLQDLKDRQLKVNTALDFQQLQGQIDSVQGEIDGITSVKPLQAPVFIRTVILPPEPEGIEKLQNARKTILDDQEAFQEKYTALVESGLEDAFEAFGTAIGEGQDPFAALGKSIGLSLANFASQLGKDLVGLGKLFAALQAALKGLGPGAKIAIGLALIAFGAAVKAAINKRGKEQGFARGGYIDGPGTETSDSIPARLSKGEYVVRARVVKRYGKNFFESLNNNLLPPPSILGRQANDETLADAVKQFGRNGGSSKALVNRFEAPLLFANGGYVDDFWENIISKGRSGGTTKALVNRMAPGGDLGEAIKQFGRKGGSSKALVNRFEVPDFGQMSQPAMPRMQTSTEPQIIATTKVSGQDLKIILERADKRYSSVT